MRTLKEEIKLQNELNKYKRKCKNCGHVMIFLKTSKRNKIVCTYCGKYVYKNDLIEFKEKLNDKILKYDCS